MTIEISNTTNTDVCLCIENENYLIKGNSSCIIDTDIQFNYIFVKRLSDFSLPDYKKALWTEILGVFSVLFIKPWFYTFDVSSKYIISGDYPNNIAMNIIRIINKSNPEAIYDAICIETSDFDISNVIYSVENKDNVSQMYKKCRDVGHSWIYGTAIVLFTLIGLTITHPLLFVIYSTTKALFAKVLLFLIPILLIACICVFCILPLHLIFKYQDKCFYRAMENKEIYSFLSKHQSKTGDGSVS